MRSFPRFATAALTAAALAVPAAAQADGTPLAIYHLNDLTGDGLAATGATADTLDLPFAASHGAVRLTGSGHLDGSLAGAVRSVELWVKPTNSDRTQPLVTHGDPATAGFAISLGTTAVPAAKKKLSLVVNGTAFVSRLSIPSGVWSMLAVTWDATDVRFHVNAGAATTKNVLKPGVENAALPSNPLVLGSTAKSFTGLLDEVALYDAKLALADIKAHFTATGLPYNSTPPYLTGTPEDGHTLGYVPGTWNAPITGHVWQRCDADDTCTDVGTGDTYALTAADVGKQIQLMETAHNATGDTTVVTEQTPAIAPAGSGTPPLPPPSDPVDPGTTDPGTTDPGTTSPGTTTGTTAATPTGAVNASAATCARVLVLPKPRTARYRGIGRVTFGIKATRGKAPVALSFKAPKGKLKSITYSIDGKRLKVARRAPYRVSIAGARLKPGRHTIKVLVTPRRGKAHRMSVLLKTGGC